MGDTSTLHKYIPSGRESMAAIPLSDLLPRIGIRV